MTAGRRRTARAHLQWPLRIVACSLVVAGYGALAAGLLPPSAAGAATNGYGPGVGPQTPGEHWGGAYTLAGVDGYAYCIEPGGADPLELPGDQWSPVAYPGSAEYTDGEMAALAYFAETYQGTGYPGYGVDTTAAAIAQVAYGSAGGTTPPASQGPASLVALVEQYMVTYAGPWTIRLTMSPPSGSTFQVGQNYSGTVTVTSATGNGVGGLQLTAPPTGGPAANQISNFVWLAGTTNAAGQISFTWNIDGVPPGFGGIFSAQGITVVDDAVGTAPPAYDAPGGAGGQTMMVSGASEVLGTGFGGVAQSSSVLTGTISVRKTVPDGAYYGPGGAQFQIETTSGTVLDTLTTNPSGIAGPSITLPAATTTGTQYVVHETAAPPGYGLAPNQTVTVFPGRNTVANFSGAYEEPVLAAQLGAKKVSATTGQPLAGATFAFAFDPANNGAYSQGLGSCTTGASGICQPPDQNTTGGWLPGWYQVTETTAPPGYYLPTPDPVQAVYLQPGATATASVTFGDQLLGSLQLTKTGNDTAYWPVTGAAFSVSGPAPTTTTVGTLTVGPGGVSNTLSGLVPGTYHLVETTAPPGYGTVVPWTVTVTAGHTTTTTTVADAVVPGQLRIEKVDAETGDPLAGAVFDVRYDPTSSGSYPVDLGDCTTAATGTCSPAGNDGTGLLPGNYQVTEVSAPPGYYLPSPDPVQEVTVTPGATASLTFTDPLLVAASFQKVATGNVNPTQLVLAGAVIDVTAGTTYGGTPVATCTTTAAGTCTTTAVLVSGQPYCWQEVTAPPGLASGATGCFTADNAQPAQPITVTDPGQFVEIQVEKVDSADPTVVLPGAVFDLYREDGGTGPNAPTPPTGVPVEPGLTWVAQATTGADGLATFPLQLPGYAYCAVEQQAPANFVLDATEHCTPVLTGAVGTPPATATLIVDDAPAMVTVSAHKFNSAVPDTGIPGAVYDLYVEGVGPPPGPSGRAPSGAASEPGDTWWARGTTSAGGDLHFTVPAGYAWCFREVAAPVDYTLDPALHCTAVITTATPAPTTTVAVPETLATVDVYGLKFNSTDPHQVIPGATYELVGEGTPPPGWVSRPDPNDIALPAGDWYDGLSTTDTQGIATWSVPAGSAWCMHEVTVPAGYQPDPAWHCTAVISTLTPAPTATVALPEVAVTPPAPPTAPPPAPAPPAPTPVLPPEATLAFTGPPPAWLSQAGITCLAVGGALVLIGRRRRRRNRRAGGTGPGGAPEVPPDAPSAKHPS